MRATYSAVAALFYLLACAAPAHAECAWVLWISDPRVKDGQWTYYGRHVELGPPTPQVFDTREACELESRDLTKRESGAAKAFQKLPAKWACLPDTVDPRGPKGK